MSAASDTRALHSAAPRSNSRRLKGILTFNVCPKSRTTDRESASDDTWFHELDSVLSALRAYESHATFFVCPHAMSCCPRGIENIAGGGDELALLKCGCLPDEPEKQEPISLTTAKELLEKLSGQKVAGFRDGLFPIERSDLDRWSSLATAGFRYDSSAMPCEIGDARDLSLPRYPFRVVVGAASIIEWPLATARFLGELIPASCTASPQLLPTWFTRRTIRAFNRNGWPGMVALGTRNQGKRLAKLLRDGEFGTIEMNINCQNPAELTTLRLKSEPPSKLRKQPCVTCQGDR